MVYTKFYAISTFYKNIKYIKLKYETKLLHPKEREKLKNCTDNDWLIVSLSV